MTNSIVGRPSAQLCVELFDSGGSVLLKILERDCRGDPEKMGRLDTFHAMKALDGGKVVSLIKQCTQPLRAAIANGISRAKFEVGIFK